MKYKLLIDPEREEEVIVVAHEKSELCDRIEALVIGDTKELLGYTEGEIEILDPQKTICFFVEGGHVWARTDRGSYQLKERLYQLEERFSGAFLKINQSCLVNVKKIKRFETSIGGGLAVIMEGGYRDFISRRQLKSVKERIGF